MQTALANNKGELVVPALVTGTFSNPKFAPDVQQMAQMKVKGFIPSLDNPTALGGALQNLLGGGKTPQQGAQGQQQTPQENTVQQLMGLFGKKKKPDQQPPNYYQLLQVDPSADPDVLDASWWSWILS